MEKPTKKDAEVYRGIILKLEQKIAAGKKAFGDPARLKYYRSKLEECE